MRAVHMRTPVPRSHSAAIAKSGFSRRRVYVIAGMLLLACETKHQAGAQNDESAVARSPLTLVDVLSARAARPVTEGSYWAPFLASGLTAGSGVPFVEGESPTSSTWIRVCWSRSAQYSRTIEGSRIPSAPGAEQAIRWIREAVGATWMHYANIDFFHWDRAARWLYCTDERESGRIVLGFSNANFADRGRFGEAPTRVLFDASMQTREQYQQAAYNLFGRALGVLPSGTDPFAPRTPEGVYRAQQIYGLRPSGTLIEWGGQCTRDSVADNAERAGHLDRIDCATNNDRVWRPLRRTSDDATLLSTKLNDGARCIQRFPVGDGPVTTGNCDTAQPVSFSGLKWKVTGNLCVGASTTAEHPWLQLVDCDAEPALSRWDFEFLEPTRIVLSGAKSCLAVTPTNLTGGSALTLTACEKVAVHPTFDPESQLSFAPGLQVAIENDRDAPVVGSKLVLRDANQMGDASRYYVSGRITSDGRCATAPTAPVGNVDWCVVSRECTEPVSGSGDAAIEPLEWDYHW